MWNIYIYISIGRHLPPAGGGGVTSAGARYEKHIAPGLTCAKVASVVVVTSAAVPYLGIHAVVW